MNETFYAVQNGSNLDWDYGAGIYSSAVAMAQDLMNDLDYDGQEIRIAVIDVKNNFCEKEIVVREGIRC